MQTTSVKRTVRSKRTLDRLRARLILLGYKLTKEQVLALSREAASESAGDLVARLKGAHYPVPAWEGILLEVAASAGDWGVTTWRDIDRLAYGGRRER